MLSPENRRRESSKEGRVRKGTSSSAEAGGAGPSRDTQPLRSLQRSHGNREVGRLAERERRQRDADRRDGSDGPRRRLGAFPHRRRIERALGVRVPGRAVLAPTECTREGTTAFTDGTTTFFGERDPDVRVAAHEATHVAQHAGVTGDAGLGSEGHAAAVARRVETHRPARDLIGPAGAAVTAGRRPYTEVAVPAQQPDHWDAGESVRVSDDGHMAVRQDSTYGSHHFWADPAKVTESNRILDDGDSVIRLRTQAGTIRGAAPDGTGTRLLTRVLPENVANATTGENMNIWADCGKSARDVMGAGRGTGGNYDEMTAVYREPYARMSWLEQVWVDLFGPSEDETAASSPAAMKREIFNDVLGGTGDEGLRKYMALSAAERDRLDRQLGINEYAAPGVGEGFTTSTGGSPIPGNRTWNFHWAGVVMLSTDDRTILENYAVGDPSVQNDDWEFQMYGPPSRAGQTFHEQHQATGQHGTAPTTMHVRTR